MKKMKIKKRLKEIFYDIKFLIYCTSNKENLTYSERLKQAILEVRYGLILELSLLTILGLTATILVIYKLSQIMQLC